ncbi:heterokaryon incompatibility protein [Phlyctema vagabunda]|uniref:Heterokaryon incompatibility protein n=1 Tax=Phlyctema vagabunda TaxID=108571 RepID=A0ABR4PKS5_9HELO
MGPSASQLRSDEGGGGEKKTRKRISSRYQSAKLLFRIKHQSAQLLEEGDQKESLTAKPVPERTSIASEPSAQLVGESQEERPADYPSTETTTATWYQYSQLEIEVPRQPSDKVKVPKWAANLIANPHLCWRCRTAMSENTVIPPLEITYADFLAMTCGVHCKLCLMIGRYLTPYDLERLSNCQGKSLKIQYTYLLYDQYWLFINILVDEVLDTSINFRLSRNACIPSEDPSENLYSLHQDHVMDIKKWQQHCLHTHTLCNTVSHAGTKLPSRLIKIENDASRARIYQTSDTDQGIEYTSLSHCWGPSGLDFKLLEENVEQRTAGFDVGDLPVTFQQAIQTTWKLGHSYIWIDALCIIQNNNDDWTREAANMKTIYSNSALNLGASTAAHCKQGLFRDRRQYATISCAFKRRSHAKYETLTASYRDNGAFSLESSPLTRRGWVLQEILLAPRILHFGRRHLLWECAEQRPIDITEDASLVNGPLQTSLKQQFAQFGGSLPSSSVWHNIVKQYSQCLLTYERDRLVAISAIAARLQPHIGNRYLAGLWESSLLNDLLWDFNGAACEGDSTKYIAPTWSWASVSTAIYYNEVKGRRDWIYQAEVKSAEVKLSNEAHPFGQVLGGHITLLGSLASVKLRAHRRGDGQYHPDQTVDGFLSSLSDTELAVYVKGLRLVSAAPLQDPESTSSSKETLRRRQVLINSIMREMTHHITFQLDQRLSHRVSPDHSDLYALPIRCENDLTGHVQGLMLAPATAVTLAGTVVTVHGSEVLFERVGTFRSVSSAFHQDFTISTHDTAIASFVSQYLSWSCREFEASPLARTMRRTDPETGIREGVYGKEYDITIV